MIQREDIILLSGAGVATVAFILGHPNEAFYIAMAGMGGKAVVPAIAPTVVSTPAAAVGSVVTLNSKNYVLQADGTYKPQ